MNAQTTTKAPWLPKTWALGGPPEKTLDIGLTSMFLALFVITAAWHMTIFRRNQGRGHKFLFSAALFGFSMSRIVTCSLRIASISIPTNTSLGIAASIFVGAGVLILFVVNLLWAQRILRSFCPKIGWHQATSWTFVTLYVLIFLTLAMNITVTIQSFYTQRPRTLFIDRAIQLYGQTFFAVVSSLPILIILVAIAPIRRTKPDTFGTGSMTSKILILLGCSALVSLGAWFRCGTAWQTPVPRSEPLPTYFGKEFFYLFNFGVEVVTLYVYAVARMDKRFHVPDGAKGPGSYAALASMKNINLSVVASQPGSTEELKDHSG